MIWHTRDPFIRKRVEANIAADKSSLRISYGQQEIQYASGSAFRSLQMEPAAPAPPKDGRKMTPVGSAPGTNLTSLFSIGLGDDPAAPDPNNGPSYTAFVGQDLVVMAGDLPAIAGGLDVMQGKKISLAQQDPQGLKVEDLPGVMLVGAGLTANYSKDDSDASSKHSADRPDANAARTELGGSIRFDMFGSFKAKARLARFDLGEDDKQLYVDAILTMKDAESTEQLKNLVNGVKALIGLTHQEVMPLLVPLQIRAADTSVTLHWSWPAASLADLLRLMEAQDGRKHPTTAPAALPAH
jgi:hypothetical protein